MLSLVSSRTVFQSTADYCETDHWQSDRYPTGQDQLYKHPCVLRTESSSVGNFYTHGLWGEPQPNPPQHSATLCLKGSLGGCGSLAGGKRPKPPKTQRNKLILSISLIISVVQHFCVLPSEKAINNWRQAANGTSCYPLEGFLDFFSSSFIFIEEKRWWILFTAGPGIREGFRMVNKRFWKVSY